jgi:3-methyladenine DNA glycosylase/8-oxoguanine DNA glycosylase
VAGRLLARYADPHAGTALRPFPAPHVLASVAPDELREVAGVPGARARPVVAVARACADGLRIEPGADPGAVRAALLALPGVGPWTVDYLALRALGDRDAVPATDLVLRRALGGQPSSEVTRAAAAWSPYRAYATEHLWAAEGRR